MEDFIFQFNLRVQNNGNHFTFFRAEARTVIDVTLTRGDNLHRLISNWRVSDQVQGSDHLLLEWIITISKTEFIKVRNLDKGDWSLFQEFLEEKSEEHLTCTWTKDILEKEAERLDRDIFDCLETSHPRQMVKLKVRKTLKFTDELTRRKNMFTHASPTIGKGSHFTPLSN